MSPNDPIILGQAQGIFDNTDLENTSPEQQQMMEEQQKEIAEAFKKLDEE